MKLKPGWPERGLLVFMLATAFAASARALYDIGLAAGMSPVIAASVPVVVDGTAVLVARVLGRLGTRAARIYGWVVLLLMAGVSVVANGLHGSPVVIGDLALSTWQARAVGALPPLALVLGFHLYLIVKRTDTSNHEKAVRATERTNQPKVSRPRKKASFEEKAKAAWEKAGGDLTGAELARLIGSSQATGSKLAKALRNGHAAPEDKGDLVTSTN